MGRTLQRGRRALSGHMRTAVRHRTKPRADRIEDYLKNAEIRRLLKRAGVVKMASGVKEPMRRIFFAPVPIIIKGAMELALYQKKKKITVKMIDYVIRKYADEGKLPRPYGEPGPESSKRGRKEKQ